MADVLRVIAWDDPRCVEPLRAAAQAWSAKGRGVVDIVQRPLTAFNDQPLRELSPISDVMIIDYPHIAQALHEGAIRPIGELVAPRVLASIAERCIGSAQQSFVVDGITAAFACDAACHLSASRPASLVSLGRAAPRSWDEIFNLARSRPGSVACALYHTDAISCLMSLTAGDNAAPDGQAYLLPDRESARRAIEILIELSLLVESYCWDCTPQALFAEADRRLDVAYIPFTFGYTRKTAKREGNWSFAAPPTGSGSLLGGAGMAVSSLSRRKTEAAEFASWYCGDEGQLLAGRNGGQPAGLAAWDDPEADALTNGFYSGTRQTQTEAYVRPLAAWWPAVQTAAGNRFVELLRAGADAETIIDALETTYRGLRAAA